MRGEIDEPRRDHRTAAPNLGNCGQIEVVLVVLRVSKRSCLRIGLANFGASVGCLKNAKAFGDSGHHAVLDAVVHHLDEVACAVGAAVQPALLAGAKGSVIVEGALGSFNAGGDGVEERLKRCHDVLFATDHQGEATFKAVHTAARSDVDVVDALLFKFRCLVDVVLPHRVAAVDDDVARFEHVCDFVDGCAGERRRDHDPRDSRRRECRSKFFEGECPCCPLSGDRLDRFTIDVVGHCFVTIFHRPADQALAHSPNSYHSKLHNDLSLKSDPLDLSVGSTHHGREPFHAALIS